MTTSPKKKRATSPAVGRGKANSSKNTQGRSAPHEAAAKVQKFADVLGRYIKSISVRQKDLAEAAGASASELTDWLGDKRVPGRAMVGELAWAIWSFATRTRGHITNGTHEDLKGQTLIDLVNELQTAAGHPPTAPTVDIVWEQRVLSNNDAQRKLIVGFVKAEPFTKRNDDGLSLNIAEKIISWLGAAPIFHEYITWEELILKLKNREVDLVAPILFRGIHYLVGGVELSDGIGIRMGHVALFPRHTLEVLEKAGDIEGLLSDHPPTLKSSAFLKIEVIKYMSGSSSILLQQIKPAPVFSPEFGGWEDAVKALSDEPMNKGKIRCLIVPSSTSLVLRQEGHYFDEAYLPHGVDFPLALAFGVHPKELKLLSSINIAISEMKHSGVMKELFDIYHLELCQQKKLLVDRDVMHPLAGPIKKP